MFLFKTDKQITFCFLFCKLLCNVVYIRAVLISKIKHKNMKNSRIYTCTLSLTPSTKYHSPQTFQSIDTCISVFPITQKGHGNLIEKGHLERAKIYKQGT